MADSSPSPAAGSDGGTGPPGTRRRGAALENAILDAAWEEIAAVGYARVTMDGVAARAGTGKAALYRRWPARAGLLAAAIDRRVVPVAEAPPGTGSLRGDALAVLRAVNGRCRAAEAVPDPGGELAACLRDRAARDGFGQMDLAVRRARERGEAGARRVSALAARMPVSVLHSELCLSGAAVPETRITEIVDELLMPLASDPSRAGDGAAPPA